MAESGNGDGNKASRGSVIEQSTAVTLELSLPRTLGDSAEQASVFDFSNSCHLSLAEGDSQGCFTACTVSSPRPQIRSGNCRRATGGPLRAGLRNATERKFYGFSKRTRTECLKTVLSPREEISQTWVIPPTGAF